MKILLCSCYHISSKFGGGNEQQIHHLALGLVKKKHKVIYLTSGAKNVKIFPYKIVNSPMFNLLNKPIYAKKWGEVIAKEKFDIFHAFGSGIPLLLTAAQVKFFKKKPTVLTYPAAYNPTNFLFKLGANIEHMLMPLVFGGFNTTTKFYADFVKNMWPNKKVAFVPTILSPHIRKNTGTKKSARKKVKLPKEKKVVLFVGKLSTHQYYKGIEILLNACEKLPENFMTVILGSGNLENYYRNLVKEKKLNKKIIFTGYCKNEDLPYYYKSADVLVLPSTSNSEGFGLSLIEAMYHKTATITTKVVGSAKWFEKEGGTYLIKANDSKALLKAIVMVTKKFNKDEILKAKKFSQQFTVENMTEKTLDFYQMLITK